MRSRLKKSQWGRVRVTVLTSDLWRGDLQADAGDGLRRGGQHGEDDHQHVRPPRRGVAGEVEENAQAVAIEHRHREEAAWRGGGAGGGGEMERRERDEEEERMRVARHL